jgi:hypothetical protein
MKSRRRVRMSVKRHQRTRTPSTRTQRRTRYSRSGHRGGSQPQTPSEITRETICRQIFSTSGLSDLTKFLLEEEATKFFAFSDQYLQSNPLQLLKHLTNSTVYEVFAALHATPETPVDEAAFLKWFHTFLVNIDLTLEMIYGMPFPNSNKSVSQ